MFSKNLPIHVKFYPPTGGFFAWLEIDSEISIDKIRENLIEKSVDIINGSQFSLNKNFSNCLRLGFTFYPPSQLEYACKEICLAIKKVNI
ncbi:aminotransferase class I/II-fold pyridoxal phosphate-dependent enzyme [Halomonas sp. KO116]|uniref:aminotransferase class I/II-fold pyridoxal phosphate-dependent enzyme n=1 Tax=Halomonas sp. KO116 TaxID=1504981 RepID=UPI002285D9C2|nr:aminotransferase class I/II-fold pyridoxal phosphate-dependent enzyme [Halomonas sp. KO116]